MTTLLRRQSGYSKIDKEDPEEILHRRAQFLIYKVLKQADSRGRSSFMRIRLSRLKIKIGKKLKCLRRGMLLTLSTTRIKLYKQLGGLLRAWKRLIGSGETISRLPLF
ncbi:hypothetical protein HS088_TW21G01201 [Tripterygium wilfordii]|uniref:Uncharacterized protein n=1 Tax=Tripterygium wilfordii TaxID=458696 RepID=A0A7J7C4J7_TRIWF|nr:hypothetical protein HS088_TW21G01201 [Tripterygium wilfordii]